MEHNPELAQTMLHTIGHTTRHVMGTLRDVVWAINPENDSFEQLLNRMKEFATQLLDLNDITLHLKIDESVFERSIVMNHRKELLMFFKEAINNIVKHAHTQHVWVEITEIDKNINLKIYDNGRGFDIDAPKNGNGLKNFQKRAQNLGGDFHIYSKIGEGTTLVLVFPSHHRGIAS
jgi:signal transduction histidine kinase